MSEEFREENTKGEIINGEHEGWKWLSKIKLPRALSRLKDQAESRIRNEANKIKDKAMIVTNLKNQVKQLLSRVQQLERTIREKDDLIKKKNRHIAYLNKVNMRLRKKVNSLLDNLQYYRTLVLGNKEVDGYQTTVVKQQIKNNELIQQEIGKPIQSNKQEGFELSYENYESFLTEFNKLQNEYNKIAEGMIAEGFVTEGMIAEGTNEKIITGGAPPVVDTTADGTTVEMYAYTAVLNQNKALQNQIYNNTNVFTLSDQLSNNIISKTHTLKQINNVLIFIFLIAFAFACYKIYNIAGMDIITKVFICFTLFLAVFILHLIEYILIYTVPFIGALLTGFPYDPIFSLSKPGKYDYFPNP
jgi:hypothetical protein